MKTIAPHSSTFLDYNSVIKSVWSSCQESGQGTEVPILLERVQDKVQGPRNVIVWCLDTFHDFSPSQNTDQRQSWISNVSKHRHLIPSLHPVQNISQSPNSFNVKCSQPRWRKKIQKLCKIAHLFVVSSVNGIFPGTP